MKLDGMRSKPVGRIIDVTPNQKAIALATNSNQSLVS